jgi:hypothetical protein
MMNSRGTLLGGFLALTALVLGALLWESRQADPLPQMERAGEAKPMGAVKFDTTARGSLLPPTASSKPLAPTPSPPLTQLQTALSSAEVLPHYMRLLQARLPGSFGMAVELRGACFGAMVSAVTYRGDRDGVRQEEGPATARRTEMLSPELMARRDAAAQEIWRRCEPVLQMGSPDQFELSDPHALRRRDAYHRLTEDAQAILGTSGEELSKQGLLFTEANNSLSNLAEGRRYFEGKAISPGEDGAAFRLALALARTEIGLGTTPAPNNLASLAACAAGSSCEGDWRIGYIQYSRATQAEQAKARHLVPRIKAALEANNLDAFRPPKP